MIRTGVSHVIQVQVERIGDVRIGYVGNIETEEPLIDILGDMQIGQVIIGI